MFGSWHNWLRGNGQPAQSRRGKRQRPCVELLEDRTLPSFVAAPTFAVGPNGGAGSKPVAVVTGDFNNDGILDVVTANQGTNTLSLSLGNGNGALSPATNFPLSKAPAALLAVDLTGDGRLDLVAANQNDNSISVLLNNGAGGFNPAINYAAGSGPVALAYGDFNHDGRSDLAVADTGANTVTVLLGDGHGHFTPGGTVPVGANPTSVAVADFNHDGYSDIATVSGGFGHLDVNLNNGDGTFAAPVNDATGFCANSVVVGDFNHDGQPDLAVACNFPSADGVSVLLGNADGTFQPFAKYSVGGQTPITLAVGDFNGDGAQDLVTANGQFANNSVSVLLGNGDGTFGTAEVFTAGQAPVAVAVGDFNRDGVLDVVAADQGAFMGKQLGCVSVLLGNGDGTLLASPDLVVSGPGPSVQADFTGEGFADLAVITTSPTYSGVMIFPGNGYGSFGAPLETVQINQPTAIAVGDFNGDHTMDLAVTTATGVTILLGNGDGTFGTRYDYAAGPSPAWVAIDDFNGDGHLDLAVADNSASGSVSLLLGNGDGTFAPAVSIAAGGAATYLASGNFNGDGFKDLAVVNGSAHTVTVVLGQGNGSFGPATLYTTQVGPGAVGLGDFNGDLKLDLAVPTFFGSGATSALTTFQNTGAGAFALKAAYGTDSRPVGIAVADFNGDHKLDLATANSFADNVFVFPGSGIGTFGAATAYVVGDGPNWLTAADFNGDGLPDLAVVNSNSNTVTLLETAQSVATHFRVQVVPATAKAGTAFQVIVTALDSNNRLMTGYAGTVNLTSTDGAATLPTAYQFTPTDHGVHRFTVTLRTAGARDIVVHAGSATGTASIAVVAAAANHLQLTAAAATAGTPFNLTVTALDPCGNVDTGFRALVRLTTNAPATGVSLPADHTFTAGENGVYTFTAGVTLLSAGHWSVTATNPPVTGLGGSTAVDVQAAAASQLFISAPTTATAGNAFNVTVTARDSYNNLATGFTGTVSFSSSDGNAALPADYTFAASDKGIHTFVLQPVLKTAGPQSLIVAAANCSDGEQDGIVVKPSAAVQAFFVGQPANTFIATPVNPAVVVKVEDAYGNLVSAGATITLALSSNPTGAILGGMTALTASNGLATFSGVSVSTAGQGYALVAHAGTGTSAPSSAFNIYTTTHFSLVPSSTQAQAGNAFQVTVTALDAANQPDPSYAGTIHFSSTASPLASLPADYTFQAADAGQHTFTTVMLNRAGLQALTVRDTLKTSVTGTANVTVSAAAASQLFISAPTTATAGNAFNVTVTTRDPYNNVATGFTGTVSFSSSDGNAALPADYAFAASDKGIHTFVLQPVLKTAGPQSLIVAAANCTSGEQDGIVVKPSAAAQAVFVGQPTNAFIATPVNPAVVVKVEDAYGNLVTAGATITLALSSNPTGAILGGTTALTASNGLATFSGVSVSAAGQGYTLVAHAGTGASAPSSAFNIYTTTHFSLLPSSTQAQAGTAFQVTVTALNAANQPDPSYAGTIHFSSTASSLASLPADYTFQAAGAGQHTFTTIMLNRAGLQALTVRDTLKTSATGIANVTVSAAAASQLFISAPTTATAGNAFNVTVTARDPYNNVAIGFTGTVSFSSSDGNSALPADYTFAASDKGIHTFVLQPIFRTAGPQSLIVAAANCTSGEQDGIVVKPSTAAQAFFVGQPANAFIAAPVNPAVVVKVEDAFGNLVSAGCTVTLALSSNPTGAILAGTTALTGASGLATFSGVSVSTAGQGYTLVAHAGTGASAPSSAFTVYTTTHFSLGLSSTQAQAGTSFQVTVTALDATNHPDPAYAGTIHFSSTASPLASLPADYTFQAADAGQFTFTTVMLNRAGLQALTVSDTLRTTVKGSANLTVSAAAASQMFISAPTTATAGNAFNVTVTARDPYNNVATGFAGTVSFSSSDSNAALPADYTFAASDKGIHTFVLQPVLKTAGPQSLIVAAANCTSGEQDGIVVKPGAAAQVFFVGQPANAFIATPVSPAVVVKVEDAYGNLVSAGATITLALSSNPTGAILAGTTALTASNGLATFSGVSVSKAGQGYTLVAHAGTGASAPSSAFTVYTTTHFGLILSSTQTQAGTSFQVTVTALDATNHPDPSYAGTIHFSSTASPLASLPADYTFQAADAGQHTFATVMLNRAGLQALTVSDTLKTTVKASANVTVIAAAASQFLVTGFPSTAVVNTAYSFTVIAQDTYGNTVTGYGGTVEFSNAGGTALLPSPYAFTATDRGRHVFTATLQSVGANQSLTVADQAIPTDTGTESNITVTP